MEAEASFFFRIGEDAGFLGSKILLQNVPVSMERSTVGRYLGYVDD